ncbi:MAG: hypothetical protein JOZ94_26080 [Xanthobacteraceae bacterium]|nr:hypothetical protein [Xanthobacteraceae bacterium]MBV9239322.1 hypothetical protein [Xanthobacteraceae bacterium]
MALVGAPPLGCWSVSAGSAARGSVAAAVERDSPVLSMATAGGGLAKSLAGTASPGLT